MNGLCINVLTKEESLILKAIDKIEHPEEKQKTLEEYILITKENYQPKIQKKLQEKSFAHSKKYLFSICAYCTKFVIWVKSFAQLFTANQ